MSTFRIINTIKHLPNMQIHTQNPFHFNKAFSSACISIIPHQIKRLTISNLHYNPICQSIANHNHGIPQKTFKPLSTCPQLYLSYSGARASVRNFASPRIPKFGRLANLKRSQNPSSPSHTSSPPSNAPPRPQHGNDLDFTPTPERIELPQELKFEAPLLQDMKQTFSAGAHKRMEHIQQPESPVRNSNAGEFTAKSQNKRRQNQVMAQVADRTSIFLFVLSAVGFVSYLKREKLKEWARTLL